MPDYTVTMKDGTVREFKHKPRPGGSYKNSIEYKPGFVVFIDEYYNAISIPTDSISEIETRSRW